MIRFECDYLEGAHPKIMETLAQTNFCQTIGYGEDEYCARARQKILDKCNCEDAQVHFLVGGTQANLTVIASALRPHQAMVCADTGHIAVHESGAIEATGHKVITLANTNGKISADQVRTLVRAHYADATHEHMAQPKMVYLSHPTETGTLYTKRELTDMRAVCDEMGLLLYVDGARLGYGLVAEGTDVDIPTLARLTDAFYIGGTKVGALFGEAVVLTNPQLKEDFRYIIKQHGGMFAKGRLLGIQFDALFTDGLYEQISMHAVGLAMRIKRALTEMGIEFLVNSPTNQQFPILKEEWIRALNTRYSFSDWGRVDDTCRAMRICTSWATKPEDVDELIRDIAALTR